MYPGPGAMGQFGLAGECPNAAAVVSLFLTKEETAQGKGRGEPFRCLYRLYARCSHRWWLPGTRLPGSLEPPENRRPVETWLVGGGRLGADDAAGGRVE